jgi:hypothetical protein
LGKRRSPYRLFASFFSDTIPRDGDDEADKLLSCHPLNNDSSYLGSDNGDETVKGLMI